MPVLRRKGNELKQADGDTEYLRDNEEVFYCEVTKEIFRNYDDYFEKVMLLNTTVWTCSLTGRTNLTYAEALQCERNAKKQVRQFPKPLRAPILLVADQTMQFSISDLVDDVFDYILVRHFKDEQVEAIDESGTKPVWRECVVLEALAPADDTTEPYDPEKIRYRVKCTDDSKLCGNTWVVTLVQIRRSRSILTKDKIKLFLKQQIEHRDGLLKVKQDSLKKMASNARFDTIFVGTPPLFEMSDLAKDRHAKLLERLDKKRSPVKKPTPKPQKKEVGNKAVGSNAKSKKTSKSLNNSSIEKYFSKDTTDNDGKKKEKNSATKADKQKQKQEALEEFQRIQKKMEEEAKKQAEERERCRAQYDEIVKAQHMRDDLEMADQKPLPEPHPVRSIVSDNNFGSCLVMAEFLHSFEHLLVDNSKFIKKISFPEITRAFSFREINGPLATICSTLLQTVFSLQQEEQIEADFEFSYILDQANFRVQADYQPAVINATKAAMFPKQYFSKSLTEIKLDSVSLTEVLRLHLLSGGANVDDRASRHRVLTRGGYIPTDDPAFELCFKYPHILRALATHSFYELEFEDIFRILKCLVEQILTFPSVRETLKTRFETAQKLRPEMKKLRLDEVRRELSLKEDIKQETINAKLKIDQFMEQLDTLQNKISEEGIERFKSKVQRELEEKILTLNKNSEKAKQKFENALETLRLKLFDMEIQFGADRALRNYFLIEAVPALLVENIGINNSRCFDRPVKNIPELANCDGDKRLKIFKQIAMEKTKGNDKENRVDNLLLSHMNSSGSESTEKLADLDLSGQRELLMCTGKMETCLVHGSAKRQRWSYFNTEEEISELIKSLNKRGYREMTLKSQLENDKDLILTFLRRDSSILEHLNVTDMSAHREKLTNDTSDLFPEPNFKNPFSDNLTNVLHMEMCFRLLELEDDITNGHLGNLKVKCLETWQKALAKGDFDMQADQICYGINSKKVIHNPSVTNGHSTELISNGTEEILPAEKSEERKEEPESSDEGVASGAEDEALDENSFEMPGISLGNTAQLDSSSSDNEVLKQKVHTLAIALLQIAQAVEDRFYKQPFGVKNMVKDATVNEERLVEARLSFARWTISLMNSTTYSQICVHMEIFKSSIMWARSVKNSHCILCNKRGNPQLMLLCDNCNNGEHMYCMKPKMNNIPEGDWYCRVCLPLINAAKEEAEKKKNSAKKRTYYYEDESEEDNEDMESVASSSTSNCNVCDGSLENDDVLGCFKCKRNFHKDCCKNAPKSKYSTRSWMCWKCVADAEKKEKARKRRRQASTDEESQSEDENIKSRESDGESDNDSEPPRKIQKRKTQSTGRRPTSKKDSFSSKRSSRRKTANASDDDDVSEDQEMTKSRRSRRGDDFPFDMKSLYQLLDDIARHDDAWPFLRPVQKSEVPDYYKIIKNPMDFAKIKSKLNMGDYTSNFDIMSDVQLVFANCDLYNLADTDIYKVGQSLERFVAERCADLKLPFRPSDMIAAEISSKG